MQKVIYMLLCTVTIISCKKTITPALNSGPAQIFIQGVISDTAGPYFVSVSNSVNFYSDNTYPSVSGAKINIQDSTTGLTDNLSEASPGLYITHSIMKGLYGHTYLLNVSLNGNIYTSSSTMPQPVQLDSVTFDTSDPKQIQAKTNFQDPKGITNYYKYSLNINGVRDRRFQTFDDRLSDGRYIRDLLDSDTSEIKRNDVVQLYLVGTDKKVFTYLSEAEDIAYKNADLAAPANPLSNINGGCLGYFSAQTVSSKTAPVK